jgi:hypothetical protein
MAKRASRFSIDNNAHLVCQAHQDPAALTAQTQPLTCQAFTVRQAYVSRTPERTEKRVKFGACGYRFASTIMAYEALFKGRQNSCAADLFKGHSKFNSSDVYLQSLPVQRFLPKNGMTKFWKRIATALV